MMANIKLDRNLLHLHEDVANYLRDYDEDYRKENIGIFYSYLVSNLPLLEHAVSEFGKLPELVFQTLKEDKKHIYRTSRRVESKNGINSLIKHVKLAESDLSKKFPHLPYYDKRTLELIQGYLSFLMYAVNTSEYQLEGYPLIEQLPRSIKKEFTISNKGEGQSRCKIIITGGTTSENLNIFNDLSFKNFGTSLQREMVVALPDPSYDPTYGGLYQRPDKPLVERLVFPKSQTNDLRNLLINDGFEEYG